MLRKLSLLAAATAAAKAPLPPMGWMAWEAYRGNINEALIRNVTDAMVDNGWLAAGYDTVHIDDCWGAPSRAADGRLQVNLDKFTDMKALADYVHSKGMKLGLYSAAAPLTCTRVQPGSYGHEKLDAQTFAGWGIDYLKFDACNATDAMHEQSYNAMGEALRDLPIVFSCSWGVKLPLGNASFEKMTAAGCDVWRLWHDIEAKKGYHEVPRIAEHWAAAQPTLAPWSGPPSAGKGWHDPDMILAGAAALSGPEQVAQLGAWAILQAPLILGSKLEFFTDVDPVTKAAFQNPELIAIAQDRAFEMGKRALEYPTGKQPAHEVWTRPLLDGGVAVMVWNTATPLNSTDGGCTWNVTEGLSAHNSPGREACVKSASFADTQWECCGREDCAALAWAGETGCIYANASTVNWFPSEGSARYVKVAMPKRTTHDFTVDIADLHAAGVWGGQTAKVRDILGRKDVGEGSQIVAKAVPYHGIAFFKLTSQ